MDFEPFMAKVWFVLGIYFSFVWSRFKIRLSGILWSSTRDKISCKYKSWASFFATSGISILPVVFMLFAKDDESRSMWADIMCVSSYQNFSNGMVSAKRIDSNFRTFFTFSRTFFIKVLGLFEDFQRISWTFQYLYGVAQIVTTKFIFRKIKTHPAVYINSSFYSKSKNKYLS